MILDSSKRHSMLSTSLSWNFNGGSYFVLSCFYVRKVLLLQYGEGRSYISLSIASFLNFLFFWYNFNFRLFIPFDCSDLSGLSVSLFSLFTSCSTESFSNDSVSSSHSRFYYITFYENRAFLSYLFYDSFEIVDD